MFTVSKLGAEFTFPTQGEIIIQRGSVSQRDLAPAKLLEEGGQDWVLTFNSKPNRNYWDIPFTSNNLTLHYQAPLTERFAQAECEIWTPTYVKLLDGRQHWIPQEMAGGYVAYHNTLRFRNFKTGKLFNLLVPKATDVNGLTTYGSYNRDAMTTRILRITLPQSFLDQAVFPVEVDPTFGKTSIGALEQNVPDSTYSIGTNYQTGADAGAAVLNFMALYTGVDTNQVKIGLYTNGNSQTGTPDVLVWGSDALASLTDDWVIGTTSGSPTLLANTWYTLMHRMGGATVTWHYDNGVANSGGYSTVAGGGPAFAAAWQNPFAGAYAQNSDNSSIYGSYGEEVAPASGTFLTCLWKT